MKKILSIIIASILLILCLVSCTNAGNGGNSTENKTDETPKGSQTTSAVVTEVPEGDTFTLRIEGNSSCIFEGELTFSEGETLQNVLLAFDDANENITFKGTADSYISEINGEASGKFGGWDGWLFLLNGKMSDVGISDVRLKKGDSVVFFYGDPYGANGFLFPEYSVSEGKITFTADGKPIEGLKVTLNGTEHLTDSTGSVSCAAGKYTLQIAKYAESGLSLVLRLPEDTSVEVK